MSYAAFYLHAVVYFYSYRLKGIGFKGIVRLIYLEYLLMHTVSSPNRWTIYK
jgi:hypothetical protein